MKEQIELLKQTRKNILKTIENFSFEKLNEIPKDFNNNIVWNFNHSIVTMQLLIYKFSGLEMNINADIISKYKIGTKPEDNNLKEEFELLKSIAISSVEQLEKDYFNGIFKTYNKYTTSYNFTLKNIEDAIAFNNVHEGLHFGYVMAQLKALNLK